MKLLRGISYILVGVGVSCILLSSYYIWQRQNPWRLSFSFTTNIEPAQAAEEKTLPIRIVIQNLQVDLPIYKAQIKNNEWEVSDKGVSYLTSSAIPGEQGNSVLYGHDWPNLLGSLKNATVGETIEIFFSNSTKKTFRIESTAIVTPDQSDVLKNTTDKRLTLYTCTGFFDSKRFVVVAQLQ